MKKLVVRKCSFCGTETATRYRHTRVGDLCGRHYCQFTRYGKCLEITRSDKNPIIDNRDGTSSVVIFNIKHEEVARALIDNSSIDVISQYKWSLDDNGYPQTSIKVGGRGKIFRMHNVLVKTESGVVDHINGIKLDNRICNLRACSASQNVHHCTMSPKAASGVRGVFFDSRHNLWNAHMNYRGKRVLRKYFKTKEEAVDARMCAELKYIKGFQPYQPNVKKQHINTNK